MIELVEVRAVHAALKMKGYDLMKPINTMVVEVLRAKEVPESFIDDYTDQVPANSHDFDAVANWWASYLSTHPHMSSIAFYLRSIRTPVAWVNEFDNTVPTLILKTH